MKPRNVYTEHSIRRGMLSLIATACLAVSTVPAAAATVAVGTIDNAGHYRNTAWYPSFAGNWTHIAEGDNGYLLLYNRYSGAAVTGWVDGAGQYSQLMSLPTFSSWDQVVGTGNGMVFLYNRMTGTVATGQIHPWGSFRRLQEYPGFVPAAIYNPYTGWNGGYTQAVGIKERGTVFLYNDVTGQGMTIGVSTDGTISRLATQTDFVKGFTSLTAVRNSRLLFYNARTGQCMFGGFVWGSIGQVGGCSVYKDLVISSPGSRLLLLVGMYSNSADTARLDDWTITYLQSYFRTFGSGWTKIVRARESYVFLYGPGS